MEENLVARGSSVSAKGNPCHNVAKAELQTMLARSMGATDADDFVVPAHVGSVAHDGHCMDNSSEVSLLVDGRHAQVINICRRSWHASSQNIDVRVSDAAYTHVKLFSVL